MHNQRGVSRSPHYYLCSSCQVGCYYRRGYSELMAYWLVLYVLMSKTIHTGGNPIIVCYIPNNTNTGLTISLQVLFRMCTATTGRPDKREYNAPMLKWWVMGIFKGVFSILFFWPKYIPTSYILNTTTDKMCGLYKSDKPLKLVLWTINPWRLLLHIFILWPMCLMWPCKHAPEECHFVKTWFFMCTPNKVIGNVKIHTHPIPKINVEQIYSRVDLPASSIIIVRCKWECTQWSRSNLTTL